MDERYFFVVILLNLLSCNFLALGIILIEGCMEVLYFGVKSSDN